MGLSWQQGPLAPGAVGRFLVAGPLPERMLFAEPLRRRMRVRFGGSWIADSEDVVLLHEPGRYPVAYFPLAAVADGVLQPAGRASFMTDMRDALSAAGVDPAGIHTELFGALASINPGLTGQAARSPHQPP